MKVLALNLDWIKDLCSVYKRNTTSMCSMIGENITISLSFNLKQDKDRAVKLMTQLFPTATYIEQNELLHACYFSIQRIN